MTVLNSELSYLGKGVKDRYNLNNFKGSIDDFKIYQRIISTQEINCLADICD